MLIAIMCIEMASTVTQKFKSFRKGYNKVRLSDLEDEVMDDVNISVGTSIKIICLLIFFSAVLLLLLSINTNFLFLVLGGIFFFFGLLHSSKQHISKVVYCLVEGLLVIFLSVYIHTHTNNIVTINVANRVLTIRLFLGEFMGILLFAIPSVVCLFNIMLVRDYRERTSTKLYFGLIVTAYISIIALVVFEFVGLEYLFTLASFYFVNSYYRRFCEDIKSEKIRNYLPVKTFAVIIFSNTYVLIFSMLLRALLNL